MPALYQKTLLTLLTLIAVFLGTICIEVAHMDKAVASNHVQKVDLCAHDNPDICVIFIPQEFYSSDGSSSTQYTLAVHNAN